MSGVKSYPGRTWPLSATILKSMPPAMELKRPAEGQPTETSICPMASGAVILPAEANRSTSTVTPRSWK